MFGALVQGAVALKSYKQYNETNGESGYDSKDKKMPAWDKDNKYTNNSQIKDCLDGKQKRYAGFNNIG